MRPITKEKTENRDVIKPKDDLAISFYCRAFLRAATGLVAVIKGIERVGPGVNYKKRFVGINVVSQGAE